MEEKKSIKINLKTYLISMFLILLIMGILLGYILHTGENIHGKIYSGKETVNTEYILNEVSSFLQML